MAPVILKTDVHCLRCARKIRKVLKSQYGVDDLWVSLETGFVVVAGPWLDASLLKWRIQSATGKPVDIVSDGAAAEAPPDNGQMVHLGPPQGYGSYPSYGYGGGGAFSWVTAAHHAHRQYVPNEAPVYFNDDNPNGCCNVQ
ncbi:hypothetical protein BAE44_0004895 [Dichanthelium oligosanthes]|uniref:HMA domain-containing protein n=1 Tax=Dichanthelium oligosanthes TaxID=888268 RepID=A0A1E5W9S4_9POAL|nr:hypothetical protein BAE44_0004895 [Dichanthelium oligosanthes]